MAELVFNAGSGSGVEPVGDEFQPPLETDYSVQGAILYLHSWFYFRVKHSWPLGATTMNENNAPKREWIG